MSIGRAFRRCISRVLGLGIAVLVFSSRPAVESRAGQRPVERPRFGVVLVHTALKHDLSPPLASQVASDEETAADECEGLACGTSPGATPDDPDGDQEKGPEPIPPHVPPQL